MRINMKIALLALLVFYQPSNTFSASWLCREAASSRQGEIINACGVAEADSENEARSKARDAAYEELDSICSKSPDCSNFEYTIQPLRTDCEKSLKGYKCYRGIEATISTRKRDSSIPRQSGDKLFVPIKQVMIQEDISFKVERSVVQFNSIPSGALVNVDGIQICETPCSRELQMGTHQIVIEKNNYEKFELVLKVTKDTPTVSANLANMFGFLDVSDIPENAIVKVDDIKIDEAKIRLRPGKHIVTVDSPYHQPYYKEIEIKKGVSSKLHDVLDPLYGFIDINAKDRDGNALRAKVFIDGENTNEVTPAKIKIRSGPRKIELITTNNLYSSVTRTIEADTIYNLKFILAPNTGRVTRPPPKKNRPLIETIFEKPTECNAESDCEVGYQCATIRGEYPGTCVKKGLGF